jgi:hypothetical protein
MPCWWAAAASVQHRGACTVGSQTFPARKIPTRRAPSRAGVRANRSEAPMANDDTQAALKQAATSVDTCAARCGAAQAAHAALGEHLAGLDGDTGRKARQAHRYLGDAHDALSRSIESASLAVRGAQNAAGADSYVEPTHGPQGGSQVDQSYSNGPPRDLSPEAQRARAQRAGTESGYRAKLAALRAR